MEYLNPENIGWLKDNTLLYVKLGTGINPNYANQEINLQVLDIGQVYLIKVLDFRKYSDMFMIYSQILKPIINTDLMPESNFFNKYAFTFYFPRDLILNYPIKIPHNFKMEIINNFYINKIISLFNLNKYQLSTNELLFLKNYQL